MATVLLRWLIFVPFSFRFTIFRPTIDLAAGRYVLLVQTRFTFLSALSSALQMIYGFSEAFLVFPEFRISSK